MAVYEVGSADVTAAGTEADLPELAELTASGGEALIRRCGSSPTVEADPTAAADRQPNHQTADNVDYVRNA